MENLGFDPELMALLRKTAEGEPPRTPADIQARDLKTFKLISDIVQTQIRPQFERGMYLFKDGVREERKFEVEYQRLFSRVLDFYISHTNLSIKTGFSKSKNYDQWLQLREALKLYAEQVILPLSDTLPKIGEELYIFVYYWLLSNDQKLIVENIIESRRTPPEIVEAVYGMLFMLQKARKAADDKDEPLAYSYLIDVSHLIGMRDGAAYASEYVPKATRKIVSKVAKAAQTDGYEPCRQRVRQLYAELSREPRPGGGKWFARDLAEKILKTLQDEPKYKQQKAQLLALSGIRTMCAALAKEEKTRKKSRPLLSSKQKAPAE
jgi:hypothetical protein